MDRVQSGFTSLPLLLSRGPQTLSSQLHLWLQTSFDCHVSPHSLDAQDLSLLVGQFATAEKTSECFSSLSLPLYIHPPFSNDITFLDSSLLGIMVTHYMTFRPFLSLSLSIFSPLPHLHSTRWAWFGWGSNGVQDHAHRHPPRSVNGECGATLQLCGGCLGESWRHRHITEDWYISSRLILEDFIQLALNRRSQVFRA